MLQLVQAVGDLHPEKQRLEAYFAGQKITLLAIRGQEQTHQQLIHSHPLRVSMKP